MTQNELLVQKLKEHMQRRSLFDTKRDLYEKINDCMDVIDSLLNEIRIKESERQGIVKYLMDELELKNEAIKRLSEKYNDIDYVEHK